MGLAELNWVVEQELARNGLMKVRLLLQFTPPVHLPESDRPKLLFSQFLRFRKFHSGTPAGPQAGSLAGPVQSRGTTWDSFHYTPLSAPPDEASGSVTWKHRFLNQAARLRIEFA